jgi:hypothetical protein
MREIHERIVMDENKTSLWNKNVEDMTVGDSVIVGLAFTAIPVVTMLVISGAVVATDKIGSWKRARREKRQSN